QQEKNPLVIVNGILIDGTAASGNVTIPNSVTSIGNYAFENCTSLTSITIPNGVTSIGSGAFFGCANLKSITIPNSVTSIGYYAFQDCTSLTSITIPNNVTSIGDYTFYNCTSLTSITIPNSVTSIGGFAFYNCTSLTSVTIPNSVTSIGGFAFKCCESLTSITIPNSVASIGDYAFDDTPWLKAQQEKNPLVIVNGILIDGTVASGDVVIPNSVTSIGESAFYECKNLTGITIPNSVTTIGYNAFNYCTNLSNITMSNSVTTIGVGAFEFCMRITDVYYSGSEAEWNNIDIRDYNDDLTDATIHYNYGKTVTVPDAKISQSYTSTGTSITVNWGKLDGVTGYIVYRYDGINKKWIKVKTITNASTTSATISGFTPGSVIKFKVNAYITDGGKTYYGKTNDFLYAAALGDAKISTDYSSTGTAFTLKWGKVQGATGYNVYRYDGVNKKWIKVKTVTGASTTSATVSGFTPGSVIKFKVNAYLTKGTKTYYGKTNDYLYAAAIAPCSITKSQSYTNRVAFAWDEVAGATGYKVYVYDSASSKWILVKTITDPSTTTTVESGLTPGVAYKFKVNAYLTKGTKTYYGKAGTTLTIAAK
ncbi:MAG: leucine-rich repeat protein, partial [Oscillospiraceae bacterium]